MTVVVAEWPRIPALDESAERPPAIRIEQMSASARHVRPRVSRALRPLSQARPPRANRISRGVSDADGVTRHGPTAYPVTGPRLSPLRGPGPIARQWRHPVWSEESS